MSIQKSWIYVIGAREHNLKNIDVAIPKNSLTVITGPSGSGKSSLALDILYTEGKRRYTESLSAYARQFLGVAKKPDVDRIEGLCPAIAIEQKTVGHNPRSTVGTITEIYDYLRVLFARIGKPHCPKCQIPIESQSPEAISSMLLATFDKKTLTIAAPLAIEKKGEFLHELLRFFGNGYYRFIIDGTSYKFSSIDEIKALKLRKTFRHTVDALIDLVEVSFLEQARLNEAVERAYKVSGGSCRVIVGEDSFLYCSSRACLVCASPFPELEPRLFSFNSPIGACKSCHGLGELYMFNESEEIDEGQNGFRHKFIGRTANELRCRECQGKRLNPLALAVKIVGKNIYELCQLSVQEALSFFSSLNLQDSEQKIAISLLREIINRLTFLNDVGLSYITLNRTAKTLSGGEGQRIRLATQIGSALSGVLYVLDEPSIGLHQRDNDRLIKTLKKLRDQGNTVIVVEHDMETIRSADYIIDMGPAAGIHGGTVTACGTLHEVQNHENSLTGAFLAGRKKILVPEVVRKPKGFLTVKNITKNNLKNLTVKFPLGVICGVSGVSGSGKSTLIMQALVPALQKFSFRSALQDLEEPFELVDNGGGAEIPEIIGANQIYDLIVIDQSPIGRTPRSNPATYLGVFDEIRKLFARLPESNLRGYQVGRFSFNMSEGRCFECKGEGIKRVSMHFLPDVTMVCPSCNGNRYNAQTLEIMYRNKNIADILQMSALEAVNFFSVHSHIAKRLQLLCDVGLDYLKLGQPSTTLSGGEAQRIKLVDELAKRGDKTLYILDEPTTGLHNADIVRLLDVLNRLVNKGNSVIVIEHNLDVLKTVDYLIDLGYEGGAQGGEIIAQGSPKEVSMIKDSYTGRYLKELL